MLSARAQESGSRRQSAKLDHYPEMNWGVALCVANRRDLSHVRLHAPVSSGTCIKRRVVSKGDWQADTKRVKGSCGGANGESLLCNSVKVISKRRANIERVSITDGGKTELWWGDEGEQVGCAIVLPNTGLGSGDIARRRCWYRLISFCIMCKSMDNKRSPQKRAA